MIIDIPENNHLIDLLALNLNKNPTNIAIKYFVEEQLREITYQELDKLVSSVSVQYYNLLNSKVGEGDFVVCFLADHNLDYLINLLALMKCNVTPLLLSTRNSDFINIGLIKQSQSQILITNKKVNYDIEGLNVYGLFEPNLTRPYIEDYHLVSRLKEGSKKNILILHSSGTTKLPNLVTLTNEYFIVNLKRAHSQPGSDGYQHVYNMTPLYHLFGIMDMLSMLIKGSSFTFNKQIQYDKVISNMTKSKNQGLSGLPFQLSMIYSACSETELEVLKGLNFIQFAGASFPHFLGEKFISLGINLMSTYGSTECGVLASGNLKTNLGNYKLMSMMKESLNYKLEPQGSNLFELVVKPNPTLMISNSEDGSYKTGDLFSISGDLVYLVGRKSDTIVHITGEKTNPLPIENIINENPIVKNTFLFGDNKLLNCLVLELDKELINDMDKKQVWNSIMLNVDQANLDSPKHSFVFKELIYLTVDKEIVKTSKGNLNRGANAHLFEEEIAGLYSKFEQKKQSKKLKIENKLGELELKQKIKSLIYSIIPMELSDDDNLLDLGLNSLNLVQLKNNINKNLEIDIFSTELYNLNTLKKLTSYIFNKSSISNLDFFNDKIKELVNQYCTFNNSPIISTPLPLNNEKKGGLTVLLTGSNGSFGAFLINELLTNYKIKKIYCFIRSKNDTEAQHKLEENLKMRKIQIKNTNVLQAISYNHNTKLGLSNATYHGLIKELDIIINNGWKMNFLSDLNEFQDCLKIHTELLKMCSFNPSIKFQFISSIGATFPYITVDNVDEPIKESELQGNVTNISYCNGYNLSKICSEQITSRWSLRYNFEANIFRIGQLSGDSKNGIWNYTETFPILLNGIQYMKLAPQQFPEFNWVPVDVAAKSLCELALDGVGRGIFHIINPCTTNWDEMLQIIKPKMKFQTIPNQEFLNKINSEQDPNNPLLVLIDFFNTVMSHPNQAPLLDTKVTRLASSALSKCPKIDTKLMDSYLSYWKNIKFIE